MTESPIPDQFGVLSRSSARSVDDTVSRLRGLIEAKGMKVFAVIDQRAEARRVELDLRGTVLVVFGSPVAGTPVMDAVPLAALDLPLKILIWDDHGQTTVSYVAPSVLADRYGLAPAMGQRLAGIDGLADELVGS